MKNITTFQKSINKKSFSRGWIIVIACMLIQAIPFSVASNIQPQFISYVIKGDGFTLTAFSLIFTIGTLASAIASPLIGYIYSKVNVKLFFLIGCIISGAGFASFALAKNLWQFYLIAAIVQIGTTIFSSIGIPLIINSWFNKEVRGKALSLAFAGGSIGNIVLQILVVNSLMSCGFRETYFKYGVISLIVGVPITLFLLKLPDKDTISIKEKPSSKTNKLDKSNGFSFKELRKMKIFWIFSIGYVFIGLAIAALSIQYPNYLKILIKNSSAFIGITPHFIGTIGSLFAIFSLLGNLLGGILFDKIGVTNSLIIAFILSVISCISLIFTKNSPTLSYVFSITKGLSVYSYMMGPAYLTSHFFGKKNFTTILGITNLMFAIGFSVGSTFFAIIVNKLGYTAAWSFILLFIIIAFSALIFADISVTKTKKSFN